MSTKTIHIFSVCINLASCIVIYMTFLLFSVFAIYFNQMIKQVRWDVQIYAKSYFCHQPTPVYNIKIDFFLHNNIHFLFLCSSPKEDHIGTEKSIMALVYLHFIILYRAAVCVCNVDPFENDNGQKLEPYKFHVDDEDHKGHMMNIYLILHIREKRVLICLIQWHVNLRWNRKDISYMLRLSVCVFILQFQWYSVWITMPWAMHNSTIYIPGFVQ